jgi:hypothetical protein
MTLPSRLRSLALTAHVATSVGWLGAVIAYLALVAAALTRQDAQTVRAAWVAMDVTGWFAVVPLALASVLTGLVMSLGTPWGLVRHYWVLFKLLLTVFATLVLLGHMPSVSAAASAARHGPVGVASPVADLRGFDGELLHAGGGLLVLLVTTALSVFKPRGVTRYGWRKQHQEREEREKRTASSPPDGASLPVPRPG